MHHRARGPIRFLKVKKVVISRHLFLIKKNLPDKKICSYQDDYDPNFAPNLFRDFFRKQILLPWSMFRKSKGTREKVIELESESDKMIERLGWQI